MGKRKLAVKEPDNHDAEVIGKSNGNIVHDKTKGRPLFGCSAFLISVILVAVLGFLVGLILLELNASEEDFRKSQREYFDHQSSMENVEKAAKEKTIEDVPLDVGSKDKSIPKDKDKSSTESKKDKHTDKKMNIAEEPISKKVKKEEVESPKTTIPDEKLKTVEKEIISDKSTSHKERKEKGEEKVKEKDEKDALKKDNDGTKKKEGTSEPSVKEKSTEEKKKDSGLEDLYLEVEAIAEEILKEDPENSMVKDLAPHLEGVLKDLESGKVHGLRDSLLHIKMILLDLKDRLNESRKSSTTEKPQKSTPVTSATTTKEGEKQPVEEVIPDPVYIAPRGDEKTPQGDVKKVGKKEEKIQEASKKPVTNEKVPVDEVIPEPVYIAPLGKEDEKKPSSPEAKKKAEEIKKTSGDSSARKESSPDVREKRETKPPVVKEPVKEGDLKSKEKPAAQAGHSDKESTKKAPPSTEKAPKVQSPKNENVKTETEPQKPKVDESKKDVPKLGEKKTLKSEETKPQKKPIEVEEPPKQKESVPKPKQPEVKKETKPELSKSKPGGEKQEKGKVSEDMNRSEKTEKIDKPETKTSESPKTVKREVRSEQNKVDPKPSNVKQTSEPSGSAQVKPETQGNKNIKVTESPKAETKKTPEDIKKNQPNVKDTKPDLEAKQSGDGKPPSGGSAETKIPSNPGTPGTKKEEENVQNKLNTASTLMDEKPYEALLLYESLLQEWPKSPQVLLGRAKALDKIADLERSNSRLEQCITAYELVIELADEITVPKEIMREAGLRCADRMHFRGASMWKREVKILERLASMFGTDVEVLNKIGPYFLFMEKIERGKEIFEKTLEVDPGNAFALVHVGFCLKVRYKNLDDLELAAEYLEKGLSIGGKGVRDSKFYYHLGDAFDRLGFKSDAVRIYDEGVKYGLLRSRYQRSIFNVDRLKAKPVWSSKETTYEKFFKKLESRWKEIRDEAMNILNMEDSKKSFRTESEMLTEKGVWNMFDLYIQGRKFRNNCDHAPVTCSLIEDFSPAAGCKRGQVKFSVMQPGTHVHPHAGPTNCRLRSHLGLKVPEGAYMRVVNDTFTWEEGKIFTFDDSFEHEVWNNGTDFRLILIVDAWHPELSENERKSLKPL